MFIVIGIFSVILFESVIYGAINTSMFIDGEAHIRVNSDIRITDLKVVEQVSGAYEVYNGDYSKDSVSLQVGLPSSESIMVYEVTVVNNMDIDYEVTEIIEDTYSNNIINYELIDIGKGTIIDGGTTYTFKIKFTTTENNLDNNCILILKYLFKEVENTEWSFDYTGGEQKFRVPYNGVYKLEVWGAQGGDVDSSRVGGYGGYSIGNISLNKNQILYINVGGKGTMVQGIQRTCVGGYNGGGSTVTSRNNSSCKASSGGGATHISTKSGLLMTLNGTIESIFIVAGGGEGYYYDSTNGGTWSTIYVGNGGGYIGTPSKNSVNYNSTVLSYGGTQSSGYAFGQGRGCSLGGECAGGGGGFYGGGNGLGFSQGGGSGYIGNSLLNNKVMYCYNCDESSEESIKTISTTNVSKLPISNYAKKGNGYAKITFIKDKN